MYEHLGIALVFLVLVFAGSLGDPELPVDVTPVAAVR